jgi:hypothetical protein
MTPILRFYELLVLCAARTCLARRPVGEQARSPLAGSFALRRDVLPRAATGDAVAPPPESNVD